MRMSTTTTTAKPKQESSKTFVNSLTEVLTENSREAFTSNTYRKGDGATKRSCCVLLAVKGFREVANIMGALRKGRQLGKWRNACSPNKEVTE